jgi:hypothetical protein
MVQFLKYFYQALQSALSLSRSGCFHPPPSSPASRGRNEVGAGFSVERKHSKPSDKPAAQTRDEVRNLGCTADTARRVHYVSRRNPQAHAALNDEVTFWCPPLSAYSSS